MYYRRNADSRLRSLERDLTINYTLDNLLAYNQELLRHGMPTVVAPPEFVRKALERLWSLRGASGPFNVWGIGDLQFPAFSVTKNILDEDYPGTLRPETLQQFKEIDALLRSAIPLLLSLGWVALIKQCGNVELRIKKDREWDEYIVQWIEDKRVNDDKSYHAGGLDSDAKEDAEATMQHMLQSVHPAKYPELITVPRTVMEPSGRPITPQGAVFSVGEHPHYDVRSGRLLADQWARYEDPRALVDPQYRRGSYPTAIILVERSAADSHRDHEVGPGGANYVTWKYYVPYDLGLSPSLNHGHYDMTLEDAKVDYLCRLLKLTDSCSYQLFEA